MVDVPLVSAPPDAPTVEQLLVLLAERDQVIASLVARVGELEARLGMNSQNSSKPPSLDGFVKPPPRSLRKRSGRKPGKQPGEGGSGLSPRAEPDQVVVHTPTVCTGCGDDLGRAQVVGDRRRQVFDLPPIALQVTEHRAQRRQCTGCGALSTAPFPVVASAPTCYGPTVTALGVYLMGRQHLPVARAAEMMADCFGAPVSTGWLASLLPDAAARLVGFMTVVRKQLAGAPVAHFDETGARVAGKLGWVHVAGTDTLTAYHRASGRGKDSIDAGAVLPTFTGVAVHDGLASYRRYDVEHGLCGAHHLRELAGIAQMTEQLWPTELAELLVEIHRAVNKAKDSGANAFTRRRLSGYRRRYRVLIAEGKALNPPPPRTGRRGRPALGPAGSLLRRLDDYQDDVLRFATDFRVPMDNNQAERDVRMVKLQQKISGCWRSPTGADSFLTVRSYLSTARKQNHGALDVLTQLFQNQAWIPAANPA